MVSQRMRRFGQGQHEEHGDSMMERVSSTMTEAAHRPRQMVEEYPISSSLVVFGLGVGVGILLGQALSEPLSRAWSESWREPTMSERWGRSMQDAMHQYLPEAVSRRMGA